MFVLGYNYDKCTLEPSLRAFNGIKGMYVYLHTRLQNLSLSGRI